LKKYLIDTNICIFYIRGKFNLKEKFEKVDSDNCFISEITLGELKFGVENSERKEENEKVLDRFLKGVKIIPIFHSLDLYAIEKARLRKA
jgi:tRNA(fMet)-specific endonuclease VapC